MDVPLPRPMIWRWNVDLPLPSKLLGRCLVNVTTLPRYYWCAVPKKHYREVINYPKSSKYLPMNWQYFVLRYQKALTATTDVPFPENTIEKLSIHRNRQNIYRWIVNTSYSVTKQKRLPRRLVIAKGFSKYDRCIVSEQTFCCGIPSPPFRRYRFFALGPSSYLAGVIACLNKDEKNLPFL